MAASAEYTLEKIRVLLAGGVDNFGLGKDYGWGLAKDGRIFYASDSASDQLVTGQTSFANTTPTFLLQNPADSGIVCVPLMFALNQAGSVAGNTVEVAAEIDDVDCYDSGGTAETILSSRPKNPVSGGPKCALYSNPTATAGYGVRILGLGIGQDVSPAEGAIQEVLWTPTSGIDLLDADTCLKVFTWAGTTGPTWYWTFKWAEIPLDILELA